MNGSEISTLRQTHLARGGVMGRARLPLHSLGPSPLCSSPRCPTAQLGSWESYQAAEGSSPSGLSRKSVESVPYSLLITHR